MATDDPFQTALKEFKSLSSSFFGPAVVLTAIELGVFDALAAGEASADELAKKLGASPAALRTMMGSLVSFGYLAQASTVFSLTPFSRRALVSGSPEYEGDSARMSLWFLRLCGDLTRAVRTGRSETTYETTVRADPEMASVLVRSMDQVSRGFVDALVANVPMRGVRRVLDVGGASGAYAMALLEREPAATGTVLELPHSIPEATRIIQARGFGERLRVLPADVRTDALGAGEFDVVLISNIFHLLDRESAANLARRAATALSPGGRLIIKEMVGGPAGQTPGLATYQVLMLLISNGGALHDEASYARWCSDAGLRPAGRIDCWERSSLLVYEKS